MFDRDNIEIIHRVRPRQTKRRRQVRADKLNPNQQLDMRPWCIPSCVWRFVLDPDSVLVDHTTGRATIQGQFTLELDKDEHIPIKRKND